MSNSNNEKGSFLYLLETEVRGPKFMKEAMEKAGSKLTPDIAVNSIFLLIKSVDELNEWVAEINKLPSKFTKYAEFKYHAKGVLNTIMCFMKFNEDLTLTQESMTVLRKELKKYFVELGISPSLLSPFSVSKELQRIISNPNNEEALFRYLLEAEMRRPTDLVGHLINKEITPDMVFDLVDSEEFKKWAAETYKNSNKHSRYIEFSHQVKDVLFNVGHDMSPSKDLTSRRKIMDQLRETFRIHFMELGENKSFKQ